MKNQLENQKQVQNQRQEVRVGTGLIVVKNGDILVGKRKGSHAAGLYSFPGGHLDWEETWEDCVLRELREECGDDIKVKIKPYSSSRPEFFVTNNIMSNYQKHYITIFMVAEWIEGEPINAEPHKCEGWEWVSFDKLKEITNSGDCAEWIPIPLIVEHKEQIGIG